MLSRRKWGFYLTLWDGKTFKVKLLYFKRWGQISLQFHNYRNELWLFLKGVGNLFNDGNLGFIKAPVWELIKINSHHRYTAHTPTWVLEVQYGTKCEESDIVRIRE